MADAVAGKFIPAPLTAEQVKELIQIPATLDDRRQPRR
jgi:hypothetical protein